MIRILRMSRKHCVGKGENAGYKHVSLFQQMVSKAFFSRTEFTINLYSAELTITRRQNFRLVQIETNCRRHCKAYLK